MRSHTHKSQARSALLVSRARRMLHAPTPSEEALWEALRGGVLGVAFKRQVVLGGRYIVDFFALSVGLVVEVDGGVHRASRAADRRRDEKLQRLGYCVVRVDAALVLRSVNALRVLACSRSAFHVPHPTSALSVTPPRPPPAFSTDQQHPPPPQQLLQSSRISAAHKSRKALSVSGKRLSSLHQPRWPTRG